MASDGDSADGKASLEVDLLSFNTLVKGMSQTEGDNSAESHQRAPPAPPQAPGPFARHALFAAVGAVFVVISSLPAYLNYYPKYDFAPMQTFGDMTVPWGWPGLIVVFVIAPTRGSTLQNSSQAMVGAFLAVGNNAFLQPILVHLVHDTRWQVLLVCWVDYIAFVVFVFAFDFGPKARLIALHFNTAWTLKLLNPNSWVMQDHGHQDHSLDFFGVGMSCLLRTFFGCLCAFLGSHLTAGPYSLQKAGSAASAWAESAAGIFELAWKLTDAEGEGATSLESKKWLTKWLAKSSSFPAAVAAAEAATNLAWWESFGKIKQTAYSERVAAQGLGKRLCDGIEGLSIQMEKTRQHQHACRELVPPSPSPEKVQIDLSPRLLPLAREVLKETVCSPSDIGARQQKISELRAESDTLAKDLRDMRVEGDANYHPLAVLWYIEAYARMVADAGEQEVKMQHQCIRFGGIWVEATPGQVNFILRNSVNIVVGAFLGVYQFNYDGSIATNIGWLNSKYFGSSVRKSLHRILAVVLPFVVSGYMYSSFGNCEPEGVAALVIGLFLFSAVSIYWMVASVEFAYLALLSGALAPIFFCKKCTLDDGSGTLAKLTDVAVLQNVRGAVFGVGLMLLGDLLMRPKSASALAANMLLEIWGDVKKEVEDLIMFRDSSVSNSQRRVSYLGTNLPAAGPVMINCGSKIAASLPGRIAAARRYCTEAAVQPALRKAPFLVDVASEVLQAISAVRQEIMVFQDMKFGHQFIPQGILAKRRAAIITALHMADRAIKDWLAPYAETEMFAVNTVESEMLASSGVSEEPVRQTTVEPAVPAATIAAVGLLRDMEQRLASIELIFVKRGMA